MTVTVTCINDPPIAYDDFATIVESGTVTMLDDGNISVLDNDNDADGDTLIANLISGPSNAASFTLNSDGTFSYTHDGTETDSDSFIYEANDNHGGTEQATVHITILLENDPPIASDDDILTTEDIDIVIDVLANDIDPESSSLTIISTTNPVYGSVINNGQNLTYIPNQDLCGNDTFSYTIEDDAGLTDTAIVNLTITCVNDPPEAVNDTYVTQEDTTLFILEPGILDNDVDVDFQVLSAILIQDTTHGTLTLFTNGSFIYEPFASFEGLDSFTYQANDSILLSNVATVNIMVQSVQHPPVLSMIADHSVDENDTITVSLSASDIDADTLTLSADGLPVFASFTDYGDGTGSILFAPDFTDSGIYPITVTVSDGEFTDSTLFNVTVNNVNRPPYHPIDIYPTNGSIDCSTETGLLWGGGDPDVGDIVTYDVYFGDTTSIGIMVHNISETSIDLPILNPDTTYYWQIISYDDYGSSSSGPVWLFTTAYNADLYISKSVSLDNSSWFNSIEADYEDIIYWNVTVENTGDVALSDVTITDEVFHIGESFSLDIHEKRMFYYATLANSDVNNTAFVEAIDPHGNTISASDWAQLHVLGLDYIDLELSKNASVSYETNDTYEGLSHGYWKNHEEEWVGFQPNDYTGAIFEIPSEISEVNDTLYNALRFKGGKGLVKAAKLLMVQSVAALLNTAHPNISYPLTQLNLIDKVNFALNSLDRQIMLDLKDILDGYNNLGGNFSDCCKKTNCIITFTITVLNNGTVDSTGVIVTDILDTNFTFISANTLDGNYDEHTGLWLIGSISNGECVQLEIKVETSISGIYSNTAEITHADQIDIDSIPNNNILFEDDQDDVTINVTL